MRTIRTKVYSFNELSVEAQQKVLSAMYDINVNYDWWESVYDDAKQIGLQITGFDIDRGSYCKGEFVNDATECANLIIANHGEQCETYKTAKQYLEDYAKLVEKYSDGIDTDEVSEDNVDEFDDEADDLDNEFLQSLLEDYRMTLSNEYDYLTSEEAIKETIIANEYEFTKDGKQF